MKNTVALLVSALLLMTVCAACSGQSGQSRTDNTVAAESFGADGSDAGDDRQAIQDALNFARDNATADSPVTVTVDDGVFYLKQALVIYSHTRLELSGDAVLIYTGQEGLMLFGGATKNSYDAVTDIVISGGVWKGNASATGAHTEPIGFHSASKIILRGLQMQDSSDHFVMLTGVRDAVVTDCSFKDHFPISDISQSSKEALHIDFLPLDGGGLLPSENITVENCCFDNVASGIGTHHFGFGKQEKNIAVRNCRFERIQYNCVNAYSMVNLSVSGCTSIHCPVFLWCCSTECSIQSNTIYGSGEKCISINENSAAYVSDNYLSGIGTGTGNATAVLVADSSCVIENNEITDVGGRGIRIKGGNSISSVKGNKIANAVTQGIFLLDTRAVVEMNEIDGSQGIWAESSETEIIENRLNHCEYGVLNHGGVSRISGNTVTASEKTGIHITYKEECGGSAVIENNMITGAGEDDVRIGKNCVDCIVRGNNPDGKCRIACSKHADVVVLQNGKDPLPATTFVNCSITGNNARLSWQSAAGASEYVIYAYDDVNDRMRELAVTSRLSYDLENIPHDSIAQYIVVSRSAAGVECFYTYSTNAVEVATGSVAENAAVLSSQESISARPGEEAVFRVKAAGSGLRFRWEFKKKNSADWHAWIGKESSFFTAAINETWDERLVRCAVTDSSGNTVYSVPAEIVWKRNPEIVMQSGDAAAFSGEPVSFGVAVRGEDYKTRWYIRKPGANRWKIWKEHDQTTVSTIADDQWNGAQVRCVLIGKDGMKTYSKPITVSLRTKLRIMSQPSDKRLSPEEETTFATKAVGEGNLRYQWYYRKAGSEEWSVWWGHDTAATRATANDSWQGMQIKCVIMDDSGASVESRTVNISIIEN